MEGSRAVAVKEDEHREDFKALVFTCLSVCLSVSCFLAAWLWGGTSAVVGNVQCCLSGRPSPRACFSLLPTQRARLPGCVTQGSCLTLSGFIRW